MVAACSTSIEGFEGSVCAEESHQESTVVGVEFHARAGNFCRVAKLREFGSRPQAIHNRRDGVQRGLMGALVQLQSTGAGGGARKFGGDISLVTRRLYETPDSSHHGNNAVFPDAVRVAGRLLGAKTGAGDTGTCAGGRRELVWRGVPGPKDGQRRAVRRPAVDRRTSNVAARDTRQGYKL